MGSREPDGLRISLPDGKEVGQADVAQPFFSGLISLDLEIERPVIDVPAGPGKLTHRPFLIFGRSQGEPEGLKTFHGSHSTTRHALISVLKIEVYGASPIIRKIIRQVCAEAEIEVLEMEVMPNAITQSLDCPLRDDPVVCNAVPEEALRMLSLLKESRVVGVHNYDLQAYGTRYKNACRIGEHLDAHGHRQPPPGSSGLSSATCSNPEGEIRTRWRFTVPMPQGKPLFYGLFLS